MTESDWAEEDAPVNETCDRCRHYERECRRARSELARTRTDAERLEIARLRTEIRRMQIAAEYRNQQLDALHLVWCDGGCEGGVHRFDGRGPGAATQELVDLAVRNTERLQRWWANRQARQRDEEEQRR